MKYQTSLFLLAETGTREQRGRVEDAEQEVTLVARRLREAAPVRRGDGEAEVARPRQTIDGERVLEGVHLLCLVSLFVRVSSIEN